MASSTRGPAGSEDLDEAYHEYLWGEPSPRSFARRAKVVGAKKEKRVSLESDVTLDVSRYV